MVFIRACPEFGTILRSEKRRIEAAIVSLRRLIQVVTLLRQLLRRQRSLRHVTGVSF